MGQKVNPIALRIGYTKNWRSLWFADKKDFAKNIVEDYKIRDYIKQKFVQAAVSLVVIERLAEQIKVKIFSARPGVIIGRRGAELRRGGPGHGVFLGVKGEVLCRHPGETDPWMHSVTWHQQHPAFAVTSVSSSTAAVTMASSSTGAVMSGQAT